jgi:hypothetical protein
MIYFSVACCIEKKVRRSHYLSGDAVEECNFIYTVQSMHRSFGVFICERMPVQLENIAPGVDMV